MRKILYLASILRKCGKAKVDDGTTKQRQANKIGFIFLGVLIAGGLFYFGMIMNNLSFILGDPFSVFQSLYVMGTVAGVIIMIPSLIGNLYMSDDIYQLLVLPYTSLQIVCARVISSLELPAIISAVAVFPAGVGFMVSNGFSIYFSIALIMAFISIIILPLCFDVVILVIFISIIKGFKNRDTLKVIGAVLLVIFISAWIIFWNITGRNASANTAASIAAMFGKVPEILPVNFALLDLMKGELILSLLEILGIIAGFILIMFIIVKFLYLNSVLAMQDTAQENGRIEDKKLKKLVTQIPIEKQIAIRDIKLTVKNPTHLVNSYLMPIVIPAVVCIILIITSKGFMEKLPLDTFAGTTLICSYIVPIITVMGSALGSLSYTSISREGADFEFTRQLPLPFEKIIKGKELACIIATAVPCAVYALIAALVGVIFFGMQVWGIAYAVVLSLLISVYAIDKNITKDIRHPNLVWDNEAYMIKQTSTAGIVPMIIGVLIAVISILLCMIFAFGAAIALPICLILSFVLALTSHNKLKKWTKNVAKHLNM